jgi:hypothetical protein
MEHMGEAISGQTRDRFDRFNGDLAGNTCGFFHPYLDHPTRWEKK